MARYIDADKLCDSLRVSYNRLFELYKKAKDSDAATICEAELNTFMECIIRAKTQPTADVVEVKRGYDTEECRIFKCSVCGYGVDDIYQHDERNYTPVGLFKSCPWCGAKMDGTPKERGGEK